MRVLRSELTKGEARLTKIKNKDGVEMTKSEDIAKPIEDFYTELYASQTSNINQNIQRYITNVGSEEIPDIFIDLLYSNVKFMCISSIEFVMFI